MNTIILQKKYLVLVETAKDLWTLFLVIVNYIFTIKDKIELAVESIVNVVRDNIEIINSGVNNFSKVLYSYFENLGFTYKFVSIKIKSHQDIAFKNNDDGYIYSNLLAPPHF